MKVGLAIPEQLIGFDPSVVRDYAVTAEELGFRYLTLVDHVLGTLHENRNPPFAAGGIYTEKSFFHEPLTTFAFLAGLTSRIEFVTGVLVLSQRQTALVAKQAAQVALLSNDRLRLGVGTGWNYVEYESLGMDYKTRGRRLEEQVVLLRRLWSEPIIDFDSPFHRIDRAGLNPLLAQPVPIWFGGFSDIQQNRCARIGDGMLWTGNTSLSRRGNATIRETAAALGRDPETLGFQAGMTPKEGENLHDAIQAWDSAGGTHATVSPARLDAGGAGDPVATGRDLVDLLPRLREEVGDFI